MALFLLGKPQKATVENNAGGGNSDGGISSPSNSLENVHPQLQFTEKGGSDKINGHTKAPIAKLKGKEFEFLVRQERLVIGRNSATKGRQIQMKIHLPSKLL